MIRLTFYSSFLFYSHLQSRLGCKTVFVDLNIYICSFPMTCQIKIDMSHEKHWWYQQKKWKMSMCFFERWLLLNQKLFSDFRFMKHLVYIIAGFFNNHVQFFRYRAPKMQKLKILLQNKMIAMAITTTSRILSWIMNMLKAHLGRKHSFSIESFWLCLDGQLDLIATIICI